ncbi:acyltransferase family protein, partial [Cupriavidus sp. WS]|uniref:acyltransferase family protein n=1 Tax=Cupriavidus sp. WS TaxID=1312922 RepID=UPI0012DDFE84
ACMLLSYANATFPQYWFPFNANVVLAAIPFFYVGFTARSRRFRPRDLSLASILALAGGLLTASGLALPFDMKYANYGIPILSFIVAIGCIAASILVAQILTPITFIGAAFRRVGSLSMGIMFLHQPIQYAILKSIPQSGEVLRFLICFLGSYAISELLDRRHWTRVVFLGSSSKPRDNSADSQVPSIAG